MGDVCVGDILDQYLRALEAGSAPDREVLLAQHPGLAEELAAAFLGLDFVRGAAPSLAGGSEAGKSLGDYRLLREIGRGGMAVVYEAEQVSLGRRVALKVLPFAAVLDPKQLQRFKNEALAAAHLRHPHIVPVHAVGCERGVHYYAMQYIEGQSLDAAIRELKGGGAGEGARTPLSSHRSNREHAYIRRAAMLGAQAAEALDHAHQLGIVHRDVKPGNLLVDQAGTLWVTDFGLARSLNDVGLTITGELLGTIRYMSPEQALAKRAPVDHRSDVYSLGATLYELLTLEPAFPGDDPHAVIRDVASKEPAPPRRANPSLPRDLETVLLKAMSKEPSGRYATAQEMADDLRRFLEDRPVAARRPGALRRVARWSRRHRTLVGAAATVLLLATAGLGIGTALLLRENERAESNLDLALEALDRVYMDEVDGFPRIREGLPRESLQDGLGFYEALAARNVDDQDVTRLTGLAWHRASLIYRQLGEQDRAREALERATAIYRAVVPRWPKDSRLRSNLGWALADSGDLDGAIRECREAARLAPDNATAHGNLALALGRRGDFEEAIREYREALRLRPDETMVRLNLSRALRDKGDHEGAVHECREAVRLRPESANAHFALGVALSSAGRREGALAAYRDAIRLKPEFAKAHTGLGNELQDSGDPEGALREFCEAIRLDPTLAVAHASLGRALLQNGDADGAIPAYREAIRLVRMPQVGHVTMPSLPRLLHELGLALSANGDWGGAIPALREAVRLQPDFTAAYAALGSALLMTGALDDAIHALREAARLRPDGPGPHRTLGIALLAKGNPDSLYEQSRYAEAARVYGEAFGEAPSLMDDLEKGHRYNAACCAVLAASQGVADAPAWRARALEWLRDDLPAHEKADTRLSDSLEHWRRDPDLAAVRDRLADLPEAEREAWAKLWADVDAALARARGEE